MADADDDAFNRSLRTQASFAVSTIVLVAAAAYGVQFVDIESVMGTGPLLGVAGGVAIVTGARAKVREVKLLGAFVLALPLALFWGVLFFDWSPARAERPFAIVGGLALIAIVALGGRARAACAHTSRREVSTAAMMPVPEAPAASRSR